MVVNSMIVAMVAHANQNCHVTYHLGSSQRNPFLSTDFRDYLYAYFRLHPFIGKEGKPIHVHKAAIMSSLAAFRFCITASYLPAIKVCAI